MAVNEGKKTIEVWKVKPLIICACWLRHCNLLNVKIRCWERSSYSIKRFRSSIDLEWVRQDKISYLGNSQFRLSIRRSRLAYIRVSRTGGIQAKIGWVCTIIDATFRQWGTGFLAIRSCMIVTIFHTDIWKTLPLFTKSATIISHNIWQQCHPFIISATSISQILAWPL